MGFRDDGATAWRRTGRPISTKTFDGCRTRIRRDDLAGHLTTLGAGRDASVVSAASAGRQCALAALVWRRSTAAQAHR